MNTGFKIMLAVSAFLVILSVGAGLFMGYMMQAGSGLGTIGVIVFMIVAAPTLICVLVTLGIWIFHRNRLEPESTNILKPENKGWR